MLRKINWLKVFGNIFILVILSAVSFLYFVFVFIVNKQHLEDLDTVSYVRVFYLVFFHLFFFMFVWSFIQTMITDPGRVPIHWGFHLDDTEIKKKRYCLICHIFKPERCHHCSVCNRCVLNMDHHCPWVNNCVGFQNRKFFILLLFYAYLTLILAYTGMLSSVVHSVKELWNNFEKSQIADDICVLIAFSLLSILFVLLTFFFKYHISLLLQNTTTIEDLERKRSNSIASYDAGTKK